jgi:hypothetical protein
MSWGRGLAASVLLNLVVAAVAWAWAAGRYGARGYGGLSYNYDVWLWPTGLVLVASTCVGLACLAVGGWRRFGVGMLAGAVAAGLLDAAWSLGYFVSLGS